MKKLSRSDDFRLIHKNKVEKRNKFLKMILPLYKDKKTSSNSLSFMQKNHPPSMICLEKCETLRRNGV